MCRHSLWSDTTPSLRVNPWRRPTTQCGMTTIPVIASTSMPRGPTQNEKTLVIATSERSLRARPVLRSTASVAVASRPGKQSPTWSTRETAFPCRPVLWPGTGATGPTAAVSRGTEGSDYGNHTRTRGSLVPFFSPAMCRPEKAAGQNPALGTVALGRQDWIPAFAGMTYACLPC